MANFTVTEKAMAQVQKLMREQGKTMLRLKVMAGGCAGIMYKMDLDDSMKDGDVYLLDDPKFIAITTEKTKAFFEDVTLDFDDGLNGAGFVFSNPNAKNSCGCGASFKL